MTGLNIAYEETEKRSFVMQNVVALVLTLGGIVFAGPDRCRHRTGRAGRGPCRRICGTSVERSPMPALAILVVIGFAVMYRYAPSRSHPNWRWISWGSGIAAVLWMVGSVVFSFNVSHFGSYQATYGALGAVVVLLLWFWVSALVLLLGAEIDDEIDLRARKSNSPLAEVTPG